jgi:hypothetical protein
LAAHPGRTLTAHRLAQVLRQAYIKAAIIQCLMSGLRATGILAYNTDVFTEATFLTNSREQEDTNDGEVIQ